LDNAAPPLAAGRPAAGHAADAAGRRADARPSGRAGADLRPGRAERRAPGRPRLADAAARDGLDPPDRGPADDVRSRGRPQARPPDPDRPDRTRVLHHLFPGGVVLAARPAAQAPVVSRTRAGASATVSAGTSADASAGAVTRAGRKARNATTRPATTTIAP